MTHDATNTKLVRIRSVAPVSEDGCVLVLEEVEGARMIPIVAGVAEGRAIALQMSGLELPRPMTHDLLCSVIGALGGTVVRVVVTEIKDGTFYARISIRRGLDELSVDARPSDALNVAVRAGCPIYVASPVFEGAGSVLKPISTDEVAKFKDELDKADAGAFFEGLDRTEGPTEG